MIATIILMGLMGITGTTLFFIEWITAEKKLAKYKQSEIFKEVKDNGRKN